MGERRVNGGSVDGENRRISSAVCKTGIECLMGAIFPAKDIGLCYRLSAKGNVALQI